MHKKKVVYNPPKKNIIKNKSDAYTRDFFKWTVDQSKLLRMSEFSKLDIENLIEELKSLGNSEKRALESYLVVLFLHLLKIEFQPQKRSRSWENSIKNAKFQIKKLLTENPSLKRKLPELIKDAYFTARLNASSETDLDEETFPEKCPFNDCL